MQKSIETCRARAVEDCVQRGCLAESWTMEVINKNTKRAIEQKATYDEMLEFLKECGSCGCPFIARAKRQLQQHFHEFPRE